MQKYRYKNYSFEAKINTFFRIEIYWCSLNIKTVLFQAIKFSRSTQFSSIWFIDRTLSGATTMGQSEPGSDVNEWVLRIPQSSSITGISTSDCLVSYTRTLAEMQSMYSTAPSDWVNDTWSKTKSNYIMTSVLFWDYQRSREWFSLYLNSEWLSAGPGKLVTLWILSLKPAFILITVKMTTWAIDYANCISVDE